MICDKHNKNTSTFQKYDSDVDIDNHTHSLNDCKITICMIK